MLSDPRRLAVIVTIGDVERMLEVARTCAEAARAGMAVRVFFRDESIPAICIPEVASRLIPASAESEPHSTAVHAALDDLASAGDVRLYACSSSLYVWGIDSRDLIPALKGARGLIAFLADDLAGASEALTF